MARLTRISTTAVAAATLLVVAGCMGGASDVQGAGATGQPPSAVLSNGALPSRSVPPSTGAPPSQTIAPRLRVARSTPVEDPYYPDTSNPEVDALHYLLSLDWNGHRLAGDTTVVFRAAQSTDRVRLDLSGALHASAVTLDGTRIRYEQSADGIDMSTGALEADSIHTLEIVYTGTPRPTAAPSGRADMIEGLGWNVDSDGSVYTFQEPYGAFTWYPVNDHPSDKALYDADIATHGGDVAVFNGALVSCHRRGGETVSRWHLERPAASYLITLAIGPYQRAVATTPSGMPMSYWVLPQDARLLPALEREGSKAFEWLTAHAGPYPFSTFGVVVVGGGSAMETQTMITMSRSAVGRSDAVLQHEMAHQWYGDSVTPHDWRALWLNEGWAMYMQQWYERESRRLVYAGGIANWRGLDQQSRDVSGPPGDYDPTSFADVNVYLGPAMMLDAIRVRIGDVSFDALARAWPARHANSTVDRETFSSWLRSYTGVNFTPLMHRWLDSARTPAPASGHR